jgi:hypothetical protein
MFSSPLFRDQLLEASGQTQPRLILPLWNNNIVLPADPDAHTKALRRRLKFFAIRQFMVFMVTLNLAPSK